MTKKNNKRALLSSVLALIVCIAMLVGTTFAWFTDNATTSGNKIVSGNLDVALEMEENGSWVTAEGKTLKWITKDQVANVLWEPGCTYQLPKLRVVNNGNLALKYQVIISGFDGDAALRDIIEFTGIPEENTYVHLEVGGSVEFIIKGHMPESAGNEYMDKKLTGITITVVATQDTVEADSIDNQYDKDSTLPDIDTNTKINAAIELYSKKYNAGVTVPASADGGAYKLVVSDKKVISTEDNKIDVSFNADLFKDDVKVSPNGTLYEVKIKVGPFLNVEKVFHNNDEITTFTYDNNFIYFMTDSFSPFRVIASSAVPNLKMDENQKKIFCGVFEGYNPAEYDPSLAEEDSEYIAVNFKSNGKTYYNVTKRSDTKFVASGNTADLSMITNKNITADEVTLSQSGKLYSFISGLQSNEFSTVYLLPGTYNEATTIYVYSSMDIIGLGNADEVKVVKGSASSSNRHLFNCNGTKADYIEVTLRNLYLDATAKTTNNKDNAAVQSIRKSKVKCYDLTIVKGTGWGAYAFYVNGNNAVDGVKYTAYLYAENCNLNGSSVVDTSGSYKFYHYNLTYKTSTPYTTNSGNILNKKLELTNWDW